MTTSQNKTQIKISWLLHQDTEDKSQDLTTIIKHILNLLDLTIETLLIKLTDEKPFEINSIEDIVLYDLIIDNDYTLEVSNQTKEVVIMANLSQKNKVSLILNEIIKDKKNYTANKKTIMKNILHSSSNIEFARCVFSDSSSKIHNQHYKYQRRSFLSSGLVWLQYYAYEELQRQGGKTAIKKNPYIQWEEIGSGLLVQVGNSPFDAYTKEGETLLVQATKKMPLVVKI